jgi:hypothetical protein
MIGKAPRPVVPDLHREILEIHQGLSAAPSLEPSAQVDPLLSQLMQISIGEGKDCDGSLFRDRRIESILPSLRQMAATAEYLRECESAREILASADPYQELTRAPFFGNYVNLVNYELHAIRCTGRPDPASILMIGAGPMPATSILWARTLEVRVDGVDRSPVACTLGQQLYDVMSPTPGCFHLCDASDFDAVGDYELVILAASVEVDKAERLRTIERLASRMRPDSLIIVRTVNGQRRLLFPEIQAYELDGFTPEILLRPFNKVVNSVILASRD